jgi:hypothetical protein
MDLFIAACRQQFGEKNFKKGANTEGASLFGVKKTSGKNRRAKR